MSYGASHHFLDDVIIWKKDALCMVDALRSSPGRSSERFFRGWDALFSRKSRKKRFFPQKPRFSREKAGFSRISAKKVRQKSPFTSKNRVRPRKYYFCSSVVALCMGTLHGRSFRDPLSTWDALRDALLRS